MEINKDFKKWHEEKEKLHINRNTVYFSEREVWWCSLGYNIGFEQDGKNNNFERPVLVLKKFNQHILWALPMTSRDLSDKDKSTVEKYYHQFEYENNNYAIILSQLRLISSKRLLRKIWTFPEGDFNGVKQKIKALI